MKYWKVWSPVTSMGFRCWGGEPFEPENQRELLPFIKNVKVLYPNKTIWCYTGNNLEHEIWQPVPGDARSPTSFYNI